LYGRLKVRGVELTVTRKAKDMLIEKGFDLHFGARPLKRTIQKYLQDPLAMKLLKGELKEGSKVTADLDTGSLILLTK
jgi:ATP-dependent Clp protease ATP-binding subunit ClpA